MANPLRIKRRLAGGAAGAPSALLNAELAYNEQDDTLYYGKGLGALNAATAILAIGGPGAFVTLGTSQTISGAKTFGSAPTVTPFGAGIVKSSAGGLLSSAALTAGEIPTLTASKISDFDTQVRTSRLDQMAAPTADVALNSRKITGLADPTNAQDAATKAYVDATATGLDVKASVRAATTTSITLSGTQTIDGVALIAGDRVLVKNQGTGSENGIYVVAAGAWSRAADADASAEVSSGMFTFVEEGTSNADTGWILTTNNPITLGTTALTFTQFSSAGAITAGNGLTQSGSTINVVGTAGRISVAADSIDIDTAYVGQTSITTLGTIATGVWNATAISVAKGGTGMDNSGLVADRFLYTSGTGVFTSGTVTSFGRSLIDDADAATARTTLGLGTIATQAANNVAITGGSITNLTTFDGITIDGGTY
jgi:hypothetical protein